MPRKDQAKVHGSFLLGMANTFYSISALSSCDVDSLIQNVSAEDWYPISYLNQLFEALRETEYYNPTLLHQAGQKFVLAWYENGGRNLGWGSIGQIKMQDNSQSLKLVFKDYDPERLFTRLLALDEEKGYAVLEVADMLPPDFTRAIFYHGTFLWGDLLWLDLQTEILAQEQDYTHAIYTYHFKKQDQQYSNQNINEFIDQLCLSQPADISPEMAQTLAWKLKGMSAQYTLEKQINERSSEMLGKALTEQVRIRNHLEKANQIIRLQSMQDSLTGLYNKRYFDEAANDLWHCIMRQQEKITIYMIDVDFFKKYNDSYGHIKGDEALQIVANCIKQNFKRQEDIVARFGGEEFIVATTDATDQQINEQAGNLIDKVKEANIPHTASLVAKHVTITIGTASIIPSEKTKLQKLIKAADKALYVAKEQGRNRHLHSVN
ncbi:diguanylate cyclase (GGDEF) domain-containing protein [Allopseudospirillum japonicum]|uniref:diguanylate cyclase n=1 Tax=Allopseudospirillum japonicum TaxID=64971 RepID=A0A1H6U4J4_9GAMM|nr:GGDEF domain-containing protein [Allopseudospirillum japonicum]SEI87259.1 diguanylate cyclase (GGDEF) domain-containing protein [Allopseudospirillum japonicum]